MVKKDLIKKCLETPAEIAEGDYKKFYEQFGKKKKRDSIGMSSTMSSSRTIATSSRQSG